MQTIERLPRTIHELQHPKYYLPWNHERSNDGNTHITTIEGQHLPNSLWEDFYQFAENPSVRIESWIQFDHGKYGLVFRHKNPENPLAIKYIWNNSQQVTQFGNPTLYLNAIANLSATQLIQQQLGPNTVVPIYGVSIIPNQGTFVFMPYINGCNLNSLTYLDYNSKLTADDYHDAISEAKVPQIVQEVLHYIHITEKNVWIREHLENFLESIRKHPELEGRVTDIRPGNTMLTGFQTTTGKEVSASELFSGEIAIWDVIPKFRVFDPGLTG